MRAVRLRSATVTNLAVYLGYQLVSLALYGRGVLRDPTGSAVGTFDGADQGVFAWSLAWWPHAIANGIDPLQTDRVFAPDGWNLAWTSVIPGPSLLLVPITEAFGPIVSFNVLALLAPALAATSAYLLAREVSGSFAGAVLGGMLFGFGSYGAAEAINHVNLALVFPIPLAVLLVVRHLRGMIGDRRFIVLLTACLVALFLCFLETFLTLAVFGTVALGLGRLLADAPTRIRLRRTVPHMAIAVAATFAVVSPYLLAAIGRSNPIEDAVLGRDFPTDAANLITPTPAATFNWFGLDASHLATNTSEQTAYLGPILPIFLVLAVVLLRKRRTARFALVFAAVVLVCSLGSHLTWYGRSGIALPWALVDQLPLLKHAFPARFPVYLWLAIAVLVAQVVKVMRGTISLVLIFAIVLTLVPSINAANWTSKMVTPAFFQHDRWQAVVHRDDNVLLLPIGFLGNGMLWQQQAGFGFRQTGGYVSASIPTTIASLPFGRSLYGAALPANAGAELRRFLCDRSVDAIVIPDGTGGPLPAFIAEQLGARPSTGGVRAWRTPACTA